MDQRRSFRVETAEALDEAQSSAIGAMLRDGRLAALPESAREIRFGTWSGLFTGQACLVFTTSSEELESFVEGSESIRQLEPTRFSEGRWNIPITERGAELGLGHRYYQPNSVFEWYRPTLRGRGRRYEIPPDESNRGHNWGEVVIDDEGGAVFIEVTWD